MTLRILFFLLLTQVFSVCKSSEKQDTNTYEEIAKGELGEEVHFEFNQAKSYVLCTQKTEASSILKYLVIRLNDYHILKRGSYNPGYIKWINNSELELLNVPGIIKEGQNLSDFKQLIKLETPK
ncbi:MAG: hypothetical protein L0Y35_05010 [Flammeovirgaceae bacterium]|nr:hypothetical protein [Flammeovirgaceae bacterium]